MICECVVLNRGENESQRDWMKRFMCMHHWMQTDFYRDKLDIHYDCKRDGCYQSITAEIAEYCKNNGCHLL